MKKLILVILSLCLIIASSCARKPAANDENPQNDGDLSPSSPSALLWSERSFTESFTDEEISSEPLVNLTVSLPLISNNEEINAYYDNLADNLRELGQSYLNDAKDNLTFAAQNNGIFSPYAIEVSFSVVRNDEKVFSVVRSVYENTGGAHPNIVTYCDNFDVAESALIVAGDVFSVPLESAEETLKPVIWALMDKKSEEEGFGGDMYYKNAKDDLFTLWSERDFYFTDTSLALVWQNYSLAPYAAGIQTFEIPFQSGEAESVIDLKWIP